MAEKTTIHEYAALTEGAAILAEPEAGLLILTDADRHDFLHRMTTNQINKLAAGEAVVTVLTSPTARMLFVFTVLARADALWLLPISGQTTALERHLRGQIFFMDKVKVQNASTAYQRCRLMGPLAEQILTTVGFATATLADDRWLEQDGDVILKQTQFDVPGFELIVPQDRYAALITKLTDAGATLLADESAYQSYRIELGRPGSGHELTDAFNPLEAGLIWACADNKGCYTGQEIIARQITYDKITKSLVGLRSDSLLPVGAELTENGRSVGTVTSAAMHVGTETPMALAIVKRPYHEVGTLLTVDNSTATVVALPFLAVAEPVR